MSGGFGIFRRKRITPKLPARPDITNPTLETPPIGGGPAELPARTYLEVTVRSKKLKPLAKVKRKGWILPGRWPTLWLEISEYIKDAPWVNVHGNRTQRQKQALQIALHELMHVALWDDRTITHSDDEDSLLHFFVEGDTLIPSTWDLEQMQKAANRIGSIDVIIYDDANFYKLYVVMEEAIQYWNEWLGRSFFILKNRKVS